ncbi:LysR family transcriptional regulator [Streptomyces sp. KL118A]|uniref:LysR family transcriptional regulator n=1 Tax=Streptomyces sp. KL118A TaxID=3045153 RepID=UPI00278C2AC6|nr:LysR family transcriptional regulator [Streptomyces sp. KL118A]
MPLSPRTPDLAALGLLLGVVELGSPGRAAEAHGISRPSAGSRIRYLEKLVGVPVLERTPRGSRPTPAGALIQRETGSGTRTAFERALTALTPGWQPVPLLELSSTTALKNATVNGVGPAVLSSLAVQGELSAGTLKSVTVTGFDVSRSLRAVWPKGQRPTGPAGASYAVAHRAGASRPGP